MVAGQSEAIPEAAERHGFTHGFLLEEQEWPSGSGFLAGPQGRLDPLPSAVVSAWLPKRESPDVGKRRLKPTFFHASSWRTMCAWLESTAGERWSAGCASANAWA